MEGCLHFELPDQECHSLATIGTYDASKRAYRSFQADDRHQPQSRQISVSLRNSGCNGLGLGSGGTMAPVTRGSVKLEKTIYIILRQRHSPSNGKKAMYLSRPKSLLVLSSVLLVFLYCRPTLRLAVALLSLHLTWHIGSSEFYISQERDGFDLTFANYTITQESAGPEYSDLIPPILHHIALGQDVTNSSWTEARNACLELHPSWESHLWTDEKASKFVAEKYPHLKPMWDGYKYPIQRVDALRYMVLQEYGGMTMILNATWPCRQLI